jgi:hypothetical protein
LVEKETGFLAAKDVRFEAERRFEKEDGRLRVRSGTRGTLALRMDSDILGRQEFPLTPALSIRVGLAIRRGRILGSAWGGLGLGRCRTTGMRSESESLLTPAPTEDLSVGKVEFGGGGLEIAAEAEDEAVGTEPLGYYRGDFVEAREPGGGVQFHNESFVITVQNQAGPAVAFAVNPAVSIGALIKQTGPSIQRGTQPLHAFAHVGSFSW